MSDETRKVAWHCVGPEACDGCEAEELGKNCRTGCKTKDHRSYGECLRDSNLQIGNLK